MKIRLLIYVIIAVTLQVLLGIYTDKGQGGIAMLIFYIFVEIDPQMSFTFINKKEKL